MSEKARWRAFLVVAPAIFITTLDMFIVNIAFPDILRDFKGSSVKTELPEKPGPREHREHRASTVKTERRDRPAKPAKKEPLVHRASRASLGSQE